MRVYNDIYQTLEGLNSTPALATVLAQFCCAHQLDAMPRNLPFALGSRLRWRPDYSPVSRQIFAPLGTEYERNAPHSGMN